MPRRCRWTSWVAAGKAGAHDETAVARLYDYRNAHRVAQIVNRLTRSYNQAAVDMKQPLGGRARSDAGAPGDPVR